ncbi:CCDC55 protein [Moesziomyces antarcticus]|uniref:CCDC55 protein n=2 Tax=Pseudozyma antarctica TaxID=84753 RepID=A0A081CCI0_PSEA2|nr:CCDC55 protein [Moesziomyces antarcticus]GAK64376.1 CCDC55 protein [Moesziomyces antarcticus]
MSGATFQIESEPVGPKFAPSSARDKQAWQRRADPALRMSNRRSAIRQPMTAKWRQWGLLRELNHTSPSSRLVDPHSTMSDGARATKLSFGLKPASTSLKLSTKPSRAPSALAFDDGSDDDQERRDVPEASTSSSNRGGARASVNRRTDPLGTLSAKVAAPPTRAERKKQEEAEALDASVFDYDGVYDTIKEAERQVKQSKVTEDASKKPKYVEGILESAELRKRDRLRAEARMIQKQREAEGEEFADKESFVTNAYKQQQAELAKAEELESKAEAKRRDTDKGMGTFYRDMLNDTSAARDAAIAASLSAQASSSGFNEPRDRERTDAELAREAQQKGLEVELNDDNEIVDKRTLLTKGLNIVSKKRSASDTHGTAASERESRESRKERDQRRQEEYEARMNRDAQRSRQSALIEEQMLELERKRALEEDEASRRERSKIDARRNDSQAISDAKQRYLERKKQRLAATPASASAPSSATS